MMPLTKEQEDMVKEAIGVGTNWPKFTLDPRVNHRVDQILQGEDGPADWKDMSEKERREYIDEVEASRSEM